MIPKEMKRQNQCSTNNIADQLLERIFTVENPIDVRKVTCNKNPSFMYYKVTTFNETYSVDVFRKHWNLQKKKMRGSDTGR